MTFRLSSASLALAVALAAGAARADAIDGNWCSPDGKFITIKGPDVTTPGGTRMLGDYDRHHFHYVVPASEAGAGQGVFMTLQGDYLVLVRMGPDPASAARQTPQEWRRCTPPTSRRRAPVIG